MRLARPALEVVVLDRSPGAPLPPAAMRRLLVRAGASVGVTAGEVAVLLTGDAGIRALNRAFRGKDRATDVLSFPDGRSEPSRPARVGDIAISLPAARRNAKRAGHSLRREIACLLLHGFLHLAGYDHEVDGGEMAALEAELRRRLVPARRDRDGSAP